jgi:membrane protease subunit HflC
MNDKKLILIIPIVIVALGFLLSASGTIYTIDESQQVVITQFGEIIGDPITEPGLRFKMPFIQDANYFDKRLLDWEGEKTVSKTKEQKFISVEVYARWRIVDPKVFLQSVAGREETAQSRLDATIDTVVRDIIARYELSELIRSDIENPIVEKVMKGTQASTDIADQAIENILTSSDSAYEERESRIQHGREKITGEIFATAKERVTRFGIELADVRIKRINYQPETRRQVYNRMIAERRREEALYISEGQQIAAEIAGRKDREIKTIQSEAQEKVLKILGEGEALAIATYAAAYQRDAGFYKFYKSLETLKLTINDDTMLILSTDGDLYRILTSAGSVR